MELQKVTKEIPSRLEDGVAPHLTLTLDDNLESHVFRRHSFKTEESYMATWSIKDSS